MYRLPQVSQDIPTFSREADQAYFDREKRKRTISNLESSIEFKQAQLDAERGTMTDSSAKRLEREIKNQRQKIADLRAGDLPTFSRAATETQPPYMDFNRQQIRDFSSNRVGFYNGVEIPLTHVTRMNVDDFLKLSTISQNQIDEIIAEGPSVYGFSQQDKPGTFKPINNKRMADAVFDPKIADTALTASLPSLQIKNDGQVISHEGRHRVALIKQGGGRTVPVFIHFPESNVEQNIPNPSGQTLQKQGVTFLKNQYPQIFKDEFGDFQTNEFSTFAVPIKKLGEIAPLHRDSAQTKDKLDYAVQVATAPDILESTKDTVASASEYDIRMARFLASQDIPLFSRGRRDNETPSKALEEVIETVNNTARGGIPVYNLNASDTALEAAKEFIEDGALPPDDIPTFLKNLDGVDPSIVEGINSTGSRTTPKNSMGYRFIDVAKDNISGKLQYFYNNMREQIIDKADKAQKAIIKMSEENEQVRRLNNTADTSTMAAIRLMDRARGIFQGMLNTGYVTDTVDGALSLVNTVPLSISTRYNPFIEGDTGTGGLMQILAPLYSTETDLESIFKYYALLKRKQGFDKSGRKIETPITEKNLNDIRKIQSNYPVVVEAYQNYQRWNNRLIDFAVAKGLLSKTRNISELAEDISAITKESENDLKH